jgi:hypothetical protein
MTKLEKSMTNGCTWLRIIKQCLITHTIKTKYAYLGSKLI